MSLDLKLIEKAKAYAIGIHTKRNQLYGKKPYSFHLQGVVDNVYKYIEYIDPEYRTAVIMAAWCHDTLEDTGESFNDVMKVIGMRAAGIVFNVTDEQGLDRLEKQLKTMPKLMRDDLAIFVKICDRLSNSSHSKHDKPSMYNKYKKEHILFKYVLDRKDMYTDMWDELENIFNEETK